MDRRRLVILLLVMAFVIAGCAGAEGSAGPVGPEGPQGLPGPAGRDGAAGPAGPAGADGVSFQPPQYVGSEACAECHQETVDVFMGSGHPHQLTPVVDGQAPEYPFSELDGPPEGFTWDEISYVVGGYNWKARFVDNEGYLITGGEEATTQYNLENPDLDLGDDWVAYHPGQEQAYDCGSCHTTGYSPEGNQDGMPGMVGTFAFPGVQCEGCHGPGSLHVNNPASIRPIIDRDAEACTSCHTRGDIGPVSASEGFIQHQDEYQDLFPGKHAVLDCVSCHDPHTGVVQLAAAGVATTRVGCENCHFAEAANDDGGVHDRIAVDCLGCHMPHLIQSAVGAPEQFTGDLRTHAVAIDPEQIEQFVETSDGLVSVPQISLSFACRSCHNPDGFGPEVTDEELQAVARGYHVPPVEEVAPVEGEAAGAN